MFIRRARADLGESLAEGEYVAAYVDTMMTDKKEDGFATLSAVYLAFKMCASLLPYYLTTLLPYYLTTLLPYYFTSSLPY